MSHHIVFQNYNFGWNNLNPKYKQHNAIYILRNNESLINFINYIPKNFTITTRNGSKKFNIDILKETSTVISDFIESNPEIYHYHIDIEDEMNVLEKFQQIYQGELVNFKSKEINTVNQIIDLLNIQNFQQLTEKSSIIISRKHLKKYIKRIAPRSFIISTNKKDYECNIFGVLSSMVICQFMNENPMQNRYILDFPDECNEFQSICDIFNFQKVKITVNNMDSLKELSGILQITEIHNDINSFVDEHNKILMMIDSQKDLINTIEQLFGFLYHITDETIEDVKNFIIKSKWSETEENVQELAAFMLQVIKTEFSLHQNLIDLLIQLNEEANDSNKLSILAPFISDKLLSSFGESQSICSFIYKLFKFGFIPKEKIIIHLQNIFQRKETNKTIFSLNWFLPEIIEIGSLDENAMVQLCDEKQLDFILSFLPDNIEEYKKMRDLGEPNNQLTNAIRHDDVELLKSLINENYIDISKSHILYNIFEDFVQNGKTNFIDYSAAYGSIKCFKYLFLNHEIIDPITFEYSIFGSNIEIIKIANQNAVDTNDANFKRKIKNFSYRNNEFNLILPAVKKHNNDLFDWILEQKYTSKGIIGDLLHELAIKSIENGNVHSLIEIVDKGYHFINNQNYLYNLNTYQEAIEIAANNGFTSIMLLLLNLITNQKRFSIQNPQIFISFGNKSIIKIASKFMNANDIEECFIYTIKQKDFSLMEWIIDNYYQKSFSVSKNFYTTIISSPIEVWNLLLNKKIPINFSYFANNIEELASINVEVFDIIVRNSSLDVKDNLFNKILYPAITKKNKVLVKYLLNQNFEFEDDENSLILAVSTQDIEMVDTVLKYNSQPYIINKISANGTALCIAVQTKCVSIVKRLLSIPGINPSFYNSNNETPLIIAAKQHNFEIIYLLFDSFGDKFGQNEINELLSFILNIQNTTYRSNSHKNTDTSIINILTKIIATKKIDPNAIYKKTSLLHFACENNNVEMVSNLLKFDTINTNIYLPGNGNTPLILAIQQKNVEIAKLILNHPGTDLNMKNYMNQDALNIAVQNNLYEIIDLILINEKYKRKVNDINYLFYTSDKELFPHILKSKYVDVNVIFTNLNSKFPKNYRTLPLLGETKLINLVKLGQYDLVNAIIHHPSFDQEKSNISKALYIAYLRRDTKISKILINIADTLKNYKEYDTDLFGLAIEDIDIIIKILKNPSFNSKEAKYFENFIKVFNFCANNKKVPIDTIKILYEYDKEHEHLIDLNQLLPNGKSFFTAIQNNIADNIEIIKFLIEQGADPNIIDLKGICPLEYAIKIKNNEFIHLLIDTDRIDYSTKIRNNYPEYQNYLTDINNLFELLLGACDKDIIIRILKNPSFDSKKVDFECTFINVFKNVLKKLWSFEMMIILYEYDKEHEHLVDLNKLLPNGKSYFTSISSVTINKYDIFKFLISQGADPNIIDSNGTSPIEYAIEIRNIQLIHLLVDTNRINYSTKLRSDKHFINIFEFVVHRLDISIIAKILNNPSFDSKTVDFQIIFMSIFIRENSRFYSNFKLISEVMKMLYEYDKEHEHLIDFNQLLPNGKSYFTAIPKIAPHKDIFKYLIAQGADPNIIDSNGISPFEYAIELKNIKLIHLLIDTNRIDFSTNANSKKQFIDIFQFAINKLDKSIIVKILNCPSFNSKNIDFQKIFMHCFIKNNTKYLNPNIIIEMMKMLYDYDKEHENLIDLNQLLPNGKSFFTSIRMDVTNIVDIVKFLIAQGADPNIIDSDGVCPFVYAISLNNMEFIHLLIDTNKIDYSAKITSKIQSINNFEFAIHRSDKSTVIKILNSPNFDSMTVDFQNVFIRLFIERNFGFSFDIKQVVDIMKILYEYDKEHEHLIDFNQLLPNEKSYFTAIPKNAPNKLDIFKFLIAQGADLNIIDSNGVSPIMYAISLNNIELVRLLINTNRIDCSKLNNDQCAFLQQNFQKNSELTNNNHQNQFTCNNVQFEQQQCLSHSPSKTISDLSQNKQSPYRFRMKKEQQKSSLDQSYQNNSEILAATSNQAKLDQQQRSIWGNLKKKDQQKSSLNSSDRINSDHQQKSAWRDSKKKEQPKSSLDTIEKIDSDQQQCSAWGFLMKKEQPKSSLDTSDKIDSGQQQCSSWGFLMKKEQQKFSLDSPDQINSSQQNISLWGNSKKKEQKSSLDSSDQFDSNQQHKSSLNPFSQSDSNWDYKSKWGTSKKKE